MRRSLLLNALLGEEHRKRAAWNKATPIIGKDPSVWRQDAFGWTIYWFAYGDRSSDWGWEVDHRHPTALGGGDNLGNLRALHWRNNASLGGRVASLLTGKTG